MTHSPSSQQTLAELAQNLGAGGELGKKLIGGFSLWGVVGGILFSIIGFIVFRYGRSKSAFWPILIGIALMVYPYFVRDTAAIFLIGIALTGAVYFFRE